MRQRLDAVPDDVRAVAVAARSEQITFLAAAVAYYAFVSLIPLSLLGLVIASVMGGAVFEGQVVATAGEFLTPDAQNLLTEALTGESGRGGATIVGTVVLLWSGLRLFRGLDKAFSQVYGTIGSKTIVNEFLNALAVSVAIVVGVASMTVLGAAIDRVPAGDMSPQIGFALLVATLAVVFFPMYLLLPDADMDPREALPGTLFASLGWVVLGAGFQLYTANAGTFAAYGVLGGVLLLVTWLYFGALIVMLGAVVNAVLADRLDADDAAAMDYEPGYDPSGLAEGAAAAGVGRGPNGAPGPGRSGACAAGESDAHASDDRTTTDRQVQRDGARQSDTTEAMTGEDSSERPDDDADFGEETTDSDSSATGSGDPKTDGGSDADADAESGDSTGPNGPTASDEPTASDDPTDPDDPTASERVRPGTAPASEVARLNSEIADLRSELDEFEDEVDDRTVDRDEFEGDLKRYVRRRVRRGHARGWGPYLVLLYGTAMTIAALYTPYLGGGWAIFAMIVIWLSTLGLYVLMVLVGTGLSLLGVPGRLRNAIGSWRS